MHLVVLSNLEVLNASMIDSEIDQKQRMEKLNTTARKQLELLTNDNNILGIQKLDEINKNKLIENK